MSRFGVGFIAGGGGNDQFTQILLHFDGSNGSTSIVDSNINNSRSWASTRYLSTTAAKFGTTSLDLIGSNWLGNNEPYTANLTGITYGTNNWTIDFWVYPISPTQGYTLYWHGQSSTDAANTACIIQLNSNNTPRVLVSNGSSITAVNFNGSNAVSYNQWNHLALVRSGPVFTIYVNGIASGTQTNNITVPTPSLYPIIIGPLPSSLDFPGNCYVDEFRLSIGIARWTSNFTPPGAPYI